MTRRVDQSRTRDMVHQQRAVELEAAKRLVEDTISAKGMPILGADSNNLKKRNLGDDLAREIKVGG